LKILRLGKQLDLEVEALSLDPTSPDNKAILAAAQVIHNLLILGQAIFSRSVSDVFPFFLEGVEAYHDAEVLLGAFESLLVQEQHGDPTQSPAFGVIFRYVHSLIDILQSILKDPHIIACILQLETLGSVFAEIRQILAQTDKTGIEVRQDVLSFLNSLRGLLAWDPRYSTINKRFQMYNKELYHSYDNEWVPRTNDDEEDFNHVIKRPIRKQMGRKDSWFYMEHQGTGITFQQNLVRRSHVVGGTSIRQDGDQCPLERAGAIKSLTVSAIMGSMDFKVLWACVQEFDAHYEVHRWSCRLSKKGIQTCLDKILSGWPIIVTEMVAEV